MAKRGAIKLEEALYLVETHNYVVCVEQEEVTTFSRCKDTLALVPNGIKLKMYYTLRASKHAKAGKSVSATIAKQLQKFGYSAVPVLSTYSLQATA